MTTTADTNGHSVDTLEEDTPTTPLPDQLEPTSSPEPAHTAGEQQREQAKPASPPPSTTKQRPRRKRGAHDVVEEPIDPAELKARIARAQEVVTRQDTAALTEAKTASELDAEAQLQRARRAQERHQDDLDHQAEMQRRQTRRERYTERVRKDDEHEERLADLHQRREHQKAQAETKRQELLDSTDELRRAHLALQWVPKLMLAPSLIATITSAINLAVQGSRVIAPAPAGALLGFGADFVCTVAMVSLLIARMVGLAELVGTAGEQQKTRLGWFTLGDLITGGVLVALNVIAHSLPSSDGTPHDPSTGMMFLFLAGGFLFSSIFAPLAQRLLRARFAAAAAAVQQRELAARLDEPTEKVDHGTAVDVRTAALLLQLDAQGRIPGDRQEDGLPSGNKIYEAMKDHTGRGNQSSARRVRELMQIMSANYLGES